jgi:hypothetical protein
MPPMSDIRIHKAGDRAVAEIISDGVLLKSAADGRDLLFAAAAKGADWVAIHEANIAPEFFDLRSGLAGEVLQKFANYRAHLAIIGDIARYTDKSEPLAALVRESNRGRDVRFVPDIAALFGFYD